ncbi:MAG: protein-disulfide reductase DsbD [Endozoicomonas sp.]
MYSKFRQFTALLTFLLITLMLPWVSAAKANPLFNTSQTAASQTFIPVEEAFQINGRIVDDQAIIELTVTPGHYLYRDRFQFKAVNSETILGAPVYPKGVEKYDYNFEKNLEVFTEDMAVRMPIQISSSLPEIEVRFQGCAEAGLCYPPHTVTLPLISDSSHPETPPDSTETINDVNAPPGNSFQETIADSGLLTALLLFFLAGAGLTFTPCVLPMIPILSSILAGTSSSRQSRILALTLTYILSMSITFAAAGTLMGLFGAGLNLQAKLQSPWLIGPFAALFVLLSLSMFGLYELQLPQKLRDRLGNMGHQGGSLSGAALMGVLSALVVSPCVSAPLAGALIYISTTGDAIYGGLSLFALGLGMGLPLLAVGIGGRQLLPKAGSWMDNVKIFFGFTLLAIAIWMLERIIPGPAALALWGILSVGAAVQLGALDFHRKAGWAVTFQTAGLVLLIYGASLLVGAAKGNVNPLRPLASSTAGPAQIGGKSSVNFEKLTSTAELADRLKAAASSGQAVMVDVYADWCVSCKIMERNVFPAPEIAPLLSQLTLLKLDITDNTAEHQAWLNRFQLFGPPALVFFDRQGREMASIRTLGEVTAQELNPKLQQLLGG